jgi:phenylalanyl-tRNA synthetase beta subunit
MPIGTLSSSQKVTLRLRFRDGARTLRHEEVDPDVNAVALALTREAGAEFRTA